MSKPNQNSVILSRSTGVEAREVLNDLDSDLLVSPRKEIGNLRFLKSVGAATRSDAFLLPGLFSDFHRKKQSFIGSRLLAVEFDDLQKPITSLEQTAARAAFDATRAADVMSLLCADESLNLLPSIVIFSGRKSFHCIFFLSRPLNLSEMCLVQASARTMVKRRSSAANLDTVQNDALAGLDLSVFAAPTAICRLPNDSAQSGRLPQISWVVEGSDTFDPSALLQIAAVRRAEEAETRARPKAISCLKSRTRFNRDSSRLSGDFSEAEITEMLGKVSSRPNGAFACCCPVHPDQNPSALVSGKGFIFCSVCCSNGQPWIARIVRTSRGSLELTTK